MDSPYIGRIPDDVLYKIFHLVQEDDPVEFLLLQGGLTLWEYKLQRSQGSSPIVIVSHVCRYWRTVAINCPSLWYNIPDFLPEEMAVLCMKRSAPAPVTLHFH